MCSMPCERECMLADLFYRMRAIFHSKTVERELDEELILHLEYETAKLMRTGLSRDEATRQARVAFAGTEQVREQCRDARGVAVWETIRRDLRYGWGQLCRNPLFALAVVLTLAVGIGANTAIFTVVKGVLLSPLPYKDPGRLVMVWTEDPAHGVHEEGVSYPNFEDWRAANHAFDDLAILSRNNPVTLTGSEVAERVESAAVSANFFSVLGIQPAMGRVFSPEEVSRGERAI